MSKNLTKIISFILAILLTLSIPLTAYADENGNGTGDTGTGGQQNVCRPLCG